MIDRPYYETGRFKVNKDSWVVSNEIADDIANHIENFSGHEVIITGYDDNAIAYDSDGSAHMGLLTIRNSWGTNIPGGGDQYMSYDYFKVLTDEAARIVKAKVVASNDADDTED